MPDLARRPLAFAAATVVATVTAAVLVPLAAGAEPGTRGFLSLPTALGATPATYAPYGALACTSASSCLAIGPGAPVLSSGTPSGDPTATTLSGGAWGTKTALPLPAGVPVKKGDAQLLAAACADATDCTAIGAYRTATVKSGSVVDTESAGSWSSRSIASPATTPGLPSAIDGLWCASQGNCTIVGFYEASLTSITGWATSEASGVWSATPVTLTVPKTVFVAVPTSVACTAVGDCVAVGEAITGGGSVASYAWQETSGTWGSAVALPHPGGNWLVPSSVACATPITCVAVGEGSRDRAPTAATDVSGVWSARRLSLPALSPRVTSGDLDAISCSSASCVAVGSFSGSHTSVGGAVTWDDGTWSTIDLVHGVRVGAAPATSTTLTAVSCPSTTTCIAIGLASLGKDSASFSTSIVPARAVTAPAPPSGVTATALPHGLRVNWSPPIDDGGAPVTSYTATVLPGGRSCRATTDGCQLGGLAVGHRYVVSVTDTNGTATSSASARVSAVPGAVPTPPTHLEVVSSNGSATVTWTPSRAPAGERVERYQVSFLGSGRGRVVVTAAPRCRVGGLTKGHAYTVEIVAFDASGGSAQAHARFVAQ